jgi:hypothetical protein
MSIGLDDHLHYDPFPKPAPKKPGPKKLGVRPMTYEERAAWVETIPICPTYSLGIMGNDPNVPLPEAFLKVLLEKLKSFHCFSYQDLTVAFMRSSEWDHNPTWHVVAKEAPHGEHTREKVCYIVEGMVAGWNLGVAHKGR